MNQMLQFILLAAVTALALEDAEQRLDREIAPYSEKTVDTLQLSLRIIEERLRLHEVSLAAELEKSPSPELEAALRQVREAREKHLARRAEVERQQQIAILNGKSAANP